MRFDSQTTLITPQRLSRFGIEVDEALRVGGSGFLGESDAGEAELSGFFKEFHGTFSGDEDVGGLAFGMGPVLLILSRGNLEVVHITASPAGHPERSLYFVAQDLKQTHELLIHFIKSASAAAGHLGDREVGGDHVSHEHSSNKNQCSA